jgi:uncharacterized integral membrane protein
VKALLRILVLVPLALVLIGFALANHEAVTLNFDPLGLFSQPLSVTTPLFLPVAIALMVGVILGGIAMWFSEGRHRRAARLHLRDLERERRAHEESKRRLSLPTAPSIR